MEANPISFLRKSLFPHLQKRSISVVLVSWAISKTWFTFEHWLSVQMGSKETTRVLYRTFLLDGSFYTSEELISNKRICKIRKEDTAFRISFLLVLRTTVWLLSFKFLFFKKIDRLTPFSDSIIFSITILFLTVYKMVRSNEEIDSLDEQ